MANSSEPEGREPELWLPVVLECDLSGRNLHISDRASAALGNPESLSAVAAAIARRVRRMRFSGILDGSGRVWFASQAEAQVEHRSDTPAGLEQIQTNLLRHYFRLQKIEQRLSKQVRGARPSPGSVAIRQVERERVRLGRELHTGVGQMLAAIRLQLEAIESTLPDPPSDVQRSLGRIATLAGDALEQVRGISRRLHPPEWQRLSIKAALEQLWQLSGIPQKFNATLDTEQAPAEPSIEVKTLVYRTAQEAFSNLVRHAQARNVAASLRFEGSALVFTVRDDGVGFDAASVLSAAPSIASGIGLRTIREQAQEIGGKLSIESGPNGTTLELSVSLNSAS